MHFKAIAVLLAAAAILAAQNPNQAKFPQSVVTDQDLSVARNASSASLTGAISASATQIPVTDGSQFWAFQIVTIDNERILICSINGNTLNVCPGGRGFDQSTAAPHQVGAQVRGLIAAWYHNQIAAEIKAIENALGPNLSNVGDVKSVGVCTSGECFQSVPAGTVFAAPPGGGAPGFRQLLETDIPAEIARDAEIPVQSVFGRTGNISPQSGDYSASQVSNTPSGNISSTNVQAAINELDAEKSDISHSHPLAGDVTGSLSSNTVVRIQGRSVSSSAPSSGQILKWDAVNNVWTPAPDSGPVTSVFGRTGAVTKQTGDYLFSDIGGTASKSQLPASTVYTDQSNTWTSGNQDLSGATSTKPIKIVTSLPASCSVGEYVMLSTGAAGQNTYSCTAANTWSLQGGGVPDAYKQITDGSNTATASGSDVLKIRSSDGSVTVTVANNDPTHGDNVDLKLSKSAHVETFTSASTWTVTGASHGLGTCDLIPTVWADIGGGIRQVSEGYSDIRCDPNPGASQYNVTITWPSATTGTVVLIRSGGAGSGGGGGGGGSCTGGCVGGANALDEAGRISYIVGSGILGKAAGLFTDGSRLCIGCTSWDSPNHVVQIMKGSGDIFGKIGSSSGKAGFHISSGSGSNDQAYLSFDKSGVGQIWVASGVWSGDDRFSIRDPQEQFNVRFQMTKDGKAAIGRYVSPSATLDVSDDKPSAIGQVNFTGSGVNDLSTGGQYSGPTGQTYCVEIDGQGIPNSFRWGRDPQCLNWIQSNVSIVGGGAEQTLDYGVTVAFENQTGHVAGDRWTFSVTAGGSTTLKVTAGVSQAGAPLARFESLGNDELSGVSSAGTYYVNCQSVAGKCSELMSSGVNLGNASRIQWSSQPTISDPSDLSIGRYLNGTMFIGSGSGAPYFYFDGPGLTFRAGGVTGSFPALKRSGDLWEARLADDSGLTKVKGAVPTGPDQYVPYGASGQPSDGCAKFIGGKLVSTGSECGSSGQGLNKVFTSSSTWTWNSTEHGLTHCNLVWAAYTLSGGTHSFTMGMSSYSCDSGNITITWPTPTAGKLVIVTGGGAAGGQSTNIEKAFTNATTVTILGTEHGYGHRRLITRCYDSTGYRIDPESEMINPSNFDVTITFSTQKSGWCVLNGG